MAIAAALLMNPTSKIAWKWTTRWQGKLDPLLLFPSLPNNFITQLKGTATNLWWWSKMLMSLIWHYCWTLGGEESNEIRNFYYHIYHIIKPWFGGKCWSFHPFFFLEISRRMWIMFMYYCHKFNVILRTLVLFWILLFFNLFSLQVLPYYMVCSSSTMQ